jgi:hypothetical protein
MCGFVPPYSGQWSYGSAGQRWQACENNNAIFHSLPYDLFVFVPSLSWQMIVFQTKVTPQKAFPHRRIRPVVVKTRGELCEKHRGRLYI